MAKISYETLQATSNETFNNDDGVKFFSLKNNGDTAIVRIMHNSIEDFDIMTTHQIKIGDKYRKISCIRDPREPLDKCPLCAKGEKVQQRFFIHMIQYVTEDNGEIVAQPVIWERAAGEYATKLKTLIDEYGPLSENLFKIKRNGEAKSMDTTYEIMYAAPVAYPHERYPKNEEAFKNYTALGRVVLDKTFNEVSTFVSTGAFPKADSANDGASSSSAYGSAGYGGASSSTPTNMPWEGGASSAPINRPTRRY